MQFEVIVAEKLYRFICDIDSQIPQAKEALCQFLKEVSIIEDNVRKQREEQEAASKQEIPVIEEPIQA